MPLASAGNQSFRTIDRTPAIMEVPHQYGFIRSLNLFNIRGTGSTSIAFDKSTRDITLLPAKSRSDRKPSFGKPRDVVAKSLSLAYFHHADQITPEDIQDFRMVGDSIARETLENVRAEKLQDMRLAAEQTDEYLQLQALKGVMKTPDGTVFADMYQEFGVQQEVVYFNFDDSGSQIKQKITQLKRIISRQAKTGGAIGGIMVMVSPLFFDKLVSHPEFTDAYRYFSANTNPLRDSLSSYEQWGITSMVSYDGVTFYTYDAEFHLGDGVYESAFEEGEGLAIPRGVRNLFRGYNGPRNTLSGANIPGADMYVMETRDPKDTHIDLDLEMSKLYFNTRPLTAVKVEAGADPEA
jgi:hypothetical protein